MSYLLQIVQFKTELTNQYSPYFTNFGTFITVAFILNLLAHLTLPLC